MPLINCRYLSIAFAVIICASIGLVLAQRPAKLPARQKKVVQQQSAPDSVLRQKIDSRLLQALAQQHNGKGTGIETLEPVDVGMDSIGNLPVDIKATITDSLLQTITSLGGTIIYPSKEYHTVRAVIPLSMVKTIALRKDVSFIQPAEQAHHNIGTHSRM